MKWLMFIALIALVYVAVYIAPRGVIKQSPSNISYNAPKQMKVTSSAFENNSSIPSLYTCDGEDKIPPLYISGTPADTQSLAIIMDDPDSPTGTWVHWVLFNISPDLTKVSEGVEPRGVRGLNSWPKLGYGGPCPGTGTHHYHFKIYALDSEISLLEGATKDKLEVAMKGHVLDMGELVGIYQRKN